MALDLTGKKFSKLLVIERYFENKEKRSQWICKCDCGNDKITTGKLLVNGHVKSCGCLNNERRKERSKENHPSWKGGLKNKGSIAWSNAKLKGLESLSKERKHAMPNCNADKVSELYNTANGECSICKLKFDSLCLDHCHESGEIRGFLCNSCNLAIGMLGDSISKLENAIKYLKKHSKQSSQ